MNSIFNISEKYGKNAAAAESARIAMTGDENLYLNGYTVDTTTGDLVVNLTDKTKAIYGTDAEGNESIIGYETTKTEKYSPTNEAKFESFIDNVFRYNVAQNALNKMIYNLDGVIDDEEDKQLKNANKDRMNLYSGLDSYYYYGQALYNRNEALKNVTGNVDYSFGDISVDSKTGQTVVSFVDTTKPIYATVNSTVSSYICHTIIISSERPAIHRISMYSSAVLHFALRPALRMISTNSGAVHVLLC